MSACDIFPGALVSAALLFGIKRLDRDRYFGLSCLDDWPKLCVAFRSFSLICDETLLAHLVNLAEDSLIAAILQLTVQTTKFCRGNVEVEIFEGHLQGNQMGYDYFLRILPHRLHLIGRGLSSYIGTLRG